MNTYEVLEKALGLIEDEKNWCQWSVDDGEGRHCALGAVNLAHHGGTRALSVEIENRERCEAVRVLDALTGSNRGINTLADFNNSHSHAEVVALFQEAIRQEKAKAGVPIELPTTTREEVAA